MRIRILDTRVPDKINPTECSTVLDCRDVLEFEPNVSLCRLKRSESQTDWIYTCPGWVIQVLSDA